MFLANFDVDGTLADTREIDDGCFAGTLAKEFGRHEAADNASAYPCSGSGIIRVVVKNPQAFKEIRSADGAFNRPRREPDWRVANFESQLLP